MTEVASVMALLLSVALLSARRIGTAIGLVALQALCAAVASGAAGTAAVVALLGGVALPLAMARFAAAPELAVRGHPLAAWMLAPAVLLASVATLTTTAPAQHEALGAAVTLLGLLLVGLRTHALAPALGFLSAQNGVVLAAVGTAGATLPTALAVSLPLLPALALADAWRRR